MTVKILQILPTADKCYGGPIEVADSLATLFTDKGNIVTVYEGGKLFRERVSFAYYPGIKELRKIKQLVRDNDIIYIHGLWAIPTSFAAVCARFFSKPYIVLLHGMLNSRHLKRSRWKKIIYSFFMEKGVLDHASAIHCLNLDEFHDASLYGYKAPSFIIPNGVDLKKFSQPHNADYLNTLIPNAKQKVFVLFLGRLNPVKGLDLLIPAFAKAKATIPSFHLIIAGPDEKGYKKQIDQLINLYSLNDAVTFTGFISGNSKLNILKSSDIFILPSYQEGDSIAVKEALASSLPVIITPHCHLPEITGHNAGFVVGSTIESICENLIHLGNDNSLRKVMGQNAYRMIECNYTWDMIADKFIEINDDILKNKKDAPYWALDNRSISLVSQR